MTRLSAFGVLVSAFAAGCAPAAGVATAGSGEAAAGVAVVGVGQAEAPPDTAIIRAGVEVRRPTVAEARPASAEAMRRVLDALVAAGVERDQVQTTQVTVTPDYDYTEAGRRLLGYTATNTVQVRIRRLEIVGPAMDAAVTAGGDDVQLQGVTFEIEDQEPLRAEARRQAIERARARAEQLAQLLSVELGAPVAVEETSAGEPSPVPMARMEAMRASADTPVEPGTSTVRVEVRVRWAIGD